MCAIGSDLSAITSWHQRTKTWHGKNNEAKISIAGGDRHGAAVARQRQSAATIARGGENIERRRHG